MILEGIVTTRNADGSANIAPMGPKVRLADDGSPQFDRFLLRPFKSSLTFQNIARERCGVLHVTDDVLLITKAAVLASFEPPALRPADKVAGGILVDCCRFYEFVVDEFDDALERSSIEARVVHEGVVRDFFGLNRAKHAVVEAAILATRRHLIPAGDLRADFERLRPLIEKTGGPKEHEAFALLEAFVNEASVAEADR
ncbi:MAG: DUF447 family protein [Planctomycetota bacterium]|nr:DUF447 family protein [Planctomycetaceae bacterium]MDQ3332786.1 DUF447 family protein [Planctomycetota bacterium]